MEDFQKQHPIVPDYEHDYQDLQKSNNALIWYWVQVIWSSTHSLQVRYQLHRSTSSSMQIAEGIYGTRHVQTIGETELRLLDVPTLFHVLSIYHSSYMMLKMHCYTSNEIISSLSTIHTDGLPLYMVLQKLQNVNVLASLIVHVQDISDVAAPSNAANNLDSCVKYLSSIMFRHVHGLLERGDTLQIPYLNEHSSDFHYHLITILSPLARYRAMLLYKEALQAGWDPMDYLGHYFSMTAPEVTVGEFEDAISDGERSSIPLLSRSNYSPERDLMAIKEGLSHPCYSILLAACDNNTRSLYDDLKYLNPEDINELLENFDTQLIPIQIVYVSVSSSIDHLRSQRRGAQEDLIGHDTVEGGSQKLNPVIRVSGSCTESLTRLEDLNLPAYIPKEEIIVNWAAPLMNNAAYNIIGTSRSISTVVIGLLSSLGISVEKWRSVSNVLVINDTHLDMTFIISHLCPDAKIVIHKVMLELVTPVRLIKSRRLPESYSESRISTETIRSGLSNLQQEVTWTQLFLECDTFPQLVIYLLPTVLNTNKIYVELKYLVTCLNTNRITNTLLVIEANINIAITCPGIISVLQYLFFQVHLVHVPFDEKKDRFWIVCYGFHKFDSTLYYQISKTGHPQTSCAIQAFLKKKEKLITQSFDNQERIYMLSQSMINRMLHTVPLMPDRVEVCFTDWMHITLLDLSNVVDFNVRLQRYRYCLTNEAQKKRTDFASYSEGTSSYAADTTLRHQIEVLKRLMCVRQMLVQTEALKLKADSLLEEIENIPSAEQIWADEYTLEMYKGWPQKEFGRIMKGGYDMNCATLLLTGERLVRIITGVAYLKEKYNEKD